MPGAEYPLELHVVHFIKPDQLPACPEKGCPVVLGALLALTDKESELRKLVVAMPLQEGAPGKVAGKVVLNALLPADRTYITYEGSLPTPPCTEGILWHVLTSLMKISQSLLTEYTEVTLSALTRRTASQSTQRSLQRLAQSSRCSRSLSRVHVAASSLPTGRTAVQCSPLLTAQSSWRP